LVSIRARKGVGDLFVRDVVSVGNLLAQCDSFVVTPELRFLSQKLTESAEALSVVQLCEFDAIRLRAQIYLMELKLEATENRAQDMEREIAAQRARAIDLDVRESKLESFLRLYSLTTEMLDRLPEGTSREEELRRILLSQKETEEPIEIEIDSEAESIACVSAGNAVAARSPPVARHSSRAPEEWFRSQYAAMAELQSLNSRSGPQIKVVASRYT
jgi:hypothetical protein